MLRIARLQQLQRVASGSWRHSAAFSPYIQLQRSSSSVPAGSDGDKKEKKGEEEPLTNEKIWDRVLASHPEQDEIKNSDVLYEYSRKSYFGLASAGSLAHIAFWSWFKGYEQSLVEMHPVLGEPSFFSWVTNDFGSSVGFGTSIVLACLIGFHAQRSVARISVVSGGDKLRFTTHKFFGDFGKPIDVPVEYVSAHPNTKSNIILKLGNTRGFFLVDTRGKFYNRKKLESMITFRTSFSEHEKMIKKKETFEVRTDLPRTELSPFPTETPKTLSSNRKKPFNHPGNNLLTKRAPSTTQGRKKRTPSPSRKPKNQQ